MKKLLASAMLLLTSTLFTSTALADSHDIEAQYTIYHQSVVSVDVVWGSLEFDYTTGNNKSWNPVTHQFELTEGAPEWTSKKDGESNVIQMTNHSDMPVAFRLFFQKSTDFENITASFGDYDRYKSILPVAEGSSSGRTDRAVMTISGSVDQEFETVKAGTVELLITSGRYYDPADEEDGRPRDYYYDISSVQGQKMKLGAIRRLNAEPTDEYIEMATSFYSEGNRSIRLAEVGQALARIEQSDPYLYGKIKNYQAIYCEDGLYTFGSGPINRCTFIEVMEVDLDEP